MVLTVLALGIAFVLQAGGTSFAAVAQTGATPAPVVALTQSTGVPGGVVAVPVQFTGRENSAAGVLTLTVRYAPGKLTFSKLELGGVALSVDATGEVKTRRADGDMVLEVTISTPLREGRREALLDGPLAQLMFTVAKDQKPQTVIPLNVAATISGLAAGAPPAEAASRNGEVIVSNPVVISCFFYMH